MINKEQKQAILKGLVELLELPDYAYEKAVKRYDDIGSWFDREDSLVKNFHPHIFSQGSFMLGTAIRPIDETEEYDLDLVCKLKSGFSNSVYTQKNLKELVGQELELYRMARGIKEDMESKHRCWRLLYQDELNFHMDIVPCIPANERTQNVIFESMRKFNEDEGISRDASENTILITDDRHPDYKVISDEWNVSNPEGYGKWFKNRMEINQGQILWEKAQVDDVPIFKRKTPLQRCIQLLKRHRDQMFGKNESKPISIIITTLAARAYNGETDLESAMKNILGKMDNFIYHNAPRVPNPVNPNEDFADRWSMPEYEHLNLEYNFMNWISQVQIDFRHITSTTDTRFISEQAKSKFSVNINEDNLSRILDINNINIVPKKSKEHIIIQPPKPWQNNIGE